MSFDVRLQCIIFYILYHYVFTFPCLSQTYEDSNLERHLRSLPHTRLIPPSTLVAAQALSPVVPLLSPLKVAVLSLAPADLTSLTLPLAALGALAGLALTPVVALATRRDLAAIAAPTLDVLDALAPVAALANVPPLAPFAAQAAVAALEDLDPLAALAAVVALDALVPFSLATALAPVSFSVWVALVFLVALVQQPEGLSSASPLTLLAD